MNDEQRALAVEDMKRTIESAPKVEEIVKYELQIGVDPRYVAMKYGMDVERCQRYAERIKGQGLAHAQEIRDGLVEQVSLGKVGDAVIREFNINDYVLVKLNDHGRREHAEHWRQFGIAAPEIKQDAEGWSRWQMWDLMNVFGECIHLGCIPPFETTIRIEFSEERSNG